MQQKLVFTNDFEKILSIISQTLPFSKVVIIIEDNDFFNFGKDFSKKLTETGMQAINLIYSQNITSQVEDLIKEFSFIDVRGVVVFSKQVLLSLTKKDIGVEKIFFIQKHIDVYGIFFNTNNLINKTTYFFDYNAFSEQYLRKSLAIKTVHLIDYAFKNALLKNRVETLYFTKLKKELVDAVVLIEDFSANYIKLYNLNLRLESLTCQSGYPFCSANVCSYLFCKDFFNFNCSFYCSLEVIKRVKTFLKSKLKSQSFSYIERAKTLAFLSGENKNQILKNFNEQVANIDSDNLPTIKNQIEKLVLIYQKFIEKVVDKPAYENASEQLFSLCVSLSGDTCYSINSGTALREIMDKKV